MVRQLRNPEDDRRGALRAVIVVAVALSVLALQCPRSALAKKRGDEPDPVAIAAVLLDNGDPNRALEVLEGVDERAPGVDRARLHTLRGIAALQGRQYPKAARSLERALAALAADEQAEQDPRVLELYLAFAYFGAEDCERSLQALGRAGPRADERAQSFLIRGDCHRRAGRAGEALAALRRGQARFSAERALQERELLLLVELGLYRELFERAVPFLEEASEDEALLLLEALRRASAHDEAVELGERIRLRFPGSRRATLALAHAYVGAERPLSAARLFEELSFFDPAYAAEAGELYRRAGWTQMAVLSGARSPDAEKKLRQRFGILLEEGRYEEASALAPRLLRAGLLDDDEVRYALAFAMFQSRRFDDAERALRGVDDPGVFRQAAELRRAVAACREEGWQCR